MIKVNTDGESKIDNSQSDLKVDHTVINANDQEHSGPFEEFGLMKANELSQSGSAYEREDVKANKFEQSGSIQVTLIFVYYIIFVKINKILWMINFFSGQ